MIVYDFSGVKRDALFEALPEDVFIICRPEEVRALSERFNWDESTANECVNLDETVRYASYDGYDFVSLIHVEETVQRELNIFFSKKYLVLVIPSGESTRLQGLEAILCAACEGETARPGRLYYLIFSSIAAEYSDLLEGLEDEMETLAEELVKDSGRRNIDEVGRLRRKAYSVKKILRALSYIGGEILIDENRLLDKRLLPYFRSVDTRMKKLYDFAVSLYELSGEIQNIYDSRVAIKMNETVNKLTVITLFFGPLTVITGIYGMNFDFMPELAWRMGYPLALCLMAASCVFIYFVLKKKKWM